MAGAAGAQMPPAPPPPHAALDLVDDLLLGVPPSPLTGLLAALDPPGLDGDLAALELYLGADGGPWPDLGGGEGGEEPVAAPPASSSRQERTREKNRRAQRLFRERRKAAASALDTRLADLTAAVAGAGVERDVLAATARVVGAFVELGRPRAPPPAADGGGKDDAPDLNPATLAGMAWGDLERAWRGVAARAAGAAAAAAPAPLAEAVALVKALVIANPGLLVELERRVLSGRSGPVCDGARALLPPFSPPTAPQRRALDALRDAAAAWLGRLAASRAAAAAALRAGGGRDGPLASNSASVRAFLSASSAASDLAAAAAAAAPAVAAYYCEAWTGLLTPAQAAAALAGGAPAAAVALDS